MTTTTNTRAKHTRPTVTPRRWTWKRGNAGDLVGIGLFKAGRVTAHLTYAEARALADQLHDMVDKLDQP